MRHGLTCSMSEVGQCWDNAPVESFFGTLKRELVDGAEYATRAEARASIFDYIKAYYNRFRLHSSLGNVSSETFKRAFNPSHHLLRGHFLWRSALATLAGQEANERTVVAPRTELDINLSEP